MGFFQLSTLLSSDTSLSPEGSSDLKCIEAANDLLIWLTDGESALIAARTAEREKKRDIPDSRSTQIDLTQPDEEATPYLEESESAVDDVTKRILSSVDEIDGSDFPNFNIELQQPALMNGCVDMKRYQLLAVEWMRTREANHDNENDIVDVVGSENIRISLPIEGLLHVSGISKGRSNDLELWIQLYGLPIHSPERIRGQIIPPVPVCYYSEDTIKDLLMTRGHRQIIEGLKSFWYE